LNEKYIMMNLKI